MKRIILFVVFTIATFSVDAQDMIVINPQLMKDVLYRDIENIIYIPNIAQKKYTITTIPECKIEKFKYSKGDGLAPFNCFKLSDIPETKVIILKLDGPGVTYGNFKFYVLPNAPKNNQ